jgi:cytoskeletal protein CcmA (bactofilin family)
MAQTKTTIGSGTKIVGQVISEEDLTVEGRIDGGPLRVRGRLTVAAAGSVSCEDTEVGDALVIGVFSGTLRARDVVRIHTTSGRVLGEIMAARVTFVSDQGLAALSAEDKPAPAASRPTQTIAAPAAAPVPPPTPPPAAEPVAAEPPAVKPATEITGSMAMPHAEPPPAPPAEAAPRAIPSLPSLGQRAMQRKD